MRYKIMVGDRKIIKQKIEELTGERPVYTKMPRCAYILRGIAIEKDGEVTAEENADTELLESLVEAGLISALTDESPALMPSEEDRGSSNQDLSTEEDVIPEARREEAVKPSISFPLNRHKPESICNLVNTLYSKGDLISKATGGSFSASESLVEALKRGHFIFIDDVIGLIKEEGGAVGIAFENEKVVFDGFPATADPQKIKAWTILAAGINKACIEQNHVRASKTNESNERYAFRTWINRLGLTGPDIKAERSILYQNLSGHTAFRTKEDAEKWVRKQKELRDLLKQQKEAAAGLSDTENGAEE